MHWSDKFLGLDYDEENFDCATLAVAAAREIGINATLPTYTLRDSKSHSIITEHKESYAVAAEGPTEGHPVIMFKDGKPAHIGVCVNINQEWYILHNVEKMGVIRQPIYLLIEKIEGFYQWLT